MVDWKRHNEEYNKDKDRYYVVVSGDKEFRQDDFYIAVFGEMVESVTTQTIVDAVLTKMLTPIQAKYKEIKFIVGDNGGADSIVTDWALSHDYDVRRYEADWEEGGKSAGFKRNEAMYTYAGMKQHKGSILFWDGINPMTRNLIWLAQVYSCSVRVYNYKARKILTAKEMEEIRWEEDSKQREYGKA